MLPRKFRPLRCLLFPLSPSSVVSPVGSWLLHNMTVFVQLHSLSVLQGVWCQGREHEVVDESPPRNVWAQWQERQSRGMCTGSLPSRSISRNVLATSAGSKLHAYVAWNYFIEALAMTIGLVCTWGFSECASLLPRPCPALCHLQYAFFVQPKMVQAWEQGYECVGLTLDITCGLWIRAKTNIVNPNESNIPKTNEYSNIL